MQDTEQFTLQDKYEKKEGTIILSGIQALVRLPIDQHLADKKAGLNTATYISGYRGSPLGGLDIMLMRNKQRLEKNNIHFQPGINEDLAATAVYGSQIANHPAFDPKYDGVIGMWYGKAPGVDRSGDAFKHANMAGVGKNGGVLAVAGDDPISKSSTLPSHSEAAFFDAQIPLLYPGNVQEIITFGRYGFELSRYSGLWAGLKIVTDVADGFGTANITPIEHIVKPEFEYNGEPWQHTQNPTLLPQVSRALEKELYEGRQKAVKLFAAANDINRITVATDKDKIGIIAAGKTYYDMKEALYLLGLNDQKLKEYGIRILKMGMIYPIEPTIVKTFADGLEEIFVIEEKRGLMEILIRDVLYNIPDRPLIVGKTDENDNQLVKPNGELVVKDLMPILIRRLEPYIPKDLVIKFENSQQNKVVNLPLKMSGSIVPRTPYFCSGCPHNRSTQVPEGSIAGGGIGCHGLALIMERNTLGLFHMGSEGVPWVGAQHFSNRDHMFQNLGDGTLFHSGWLAIRQAVAADTNITYKILYNRAVAMTGSQPVDGGMAVPELTRGLSAEGVKKIIVLTDDLGKYSRNSDFAENVTIWHRDKLEKAQLELRDIKGVTALIYDQQCAADLRRKRKRGKAETPKYRVFINERVCEGCGDCGEKSNCLSVFPVETEFGRKTQIHQGSCNLDYTCLKGDCPAFVKVKIEKDEVDPVKFEKISDDIFDLPIEDPDMKVDGDANIYMTGIGGTGVVTTTQIVATAALLDGKYSNNLDQTGLSQKGGAVVSHVKIRSNNTDISNRIPHGHTDAFLVFDILNGATEKNLKYANPDRTIAIISRSEIPTGSMVSQTNVEFPEVTPLIGRIDNLTRQEENVYLDSVRIAETFFGSHMPANMITIGAAFQKGLIPISQESIFRAIELNGVAVKTNKQAFLVGRLQVSDPTNFLKTIEFHRTGSLDDYDREPLSDKQKDLLEDLDLNGRLREIVSIRIQELTEYQNFKYAKKYVDFLKKVIMEEKKIIGSSGDLTIAVAKYLFKLMAYKDEYEVARLFLKDNFDEELKREFGEDISYKYQLHPPLLRAMGLKNKIGLGTWFKLGYKLLYKMRFLRGSFLDIFGYAKLRKMERRLIDEYMDTISSTIEDLETSNYETVVKLAELPDIIRGYEHIKEENIEKYEEQKAELLKKLES